MPGAFGGLMKDLSSAANSIGKEIDKATKSAEQKWQEVKTNPSKELFKTSNVLQLVSRSSGRALQIVRCNTGQLVVDGCGFVREDQMHTHWVCIQEANNIVRLHNNNNYLAIHQGNTFVVNYPNPQSAGYETRLRVKAMSDNFVCIMSDQEQGRHVGVHSNGALKPAMACGTEMDGQWGVRLIYSPCQSAAPPPYHK